MMVNATLCRVGNLGIHRRNPKSSQAARSLGLQKSLCLQGSASMNDTSKQNGNLSGSSYPEAGEEFSCHYPCRPASCGDLPSLLFQCRERRESDLAILIGTA